MMTVELYLEMNNKKKNEKKKKWKTEKLTTKGNKKLTE